MTADRARRVRDLMDAALERDTADRDAFLAGACGDDGALRDEVVSLLEARARMGAYLDRPAIEAIDPTLAPGARVGAFEVIRVLGRGGGGIVYEARQEQPRRRVALKVMRGDLASEWARRRFREEAELLARLKHPGIAHVYEAGMQGGVPYFALEFVEGATDVVAYARDLRPRERLRLAARICDAIHHGHLNGVVHRDLKPGNVLVDDAGRVKVIDFGIARVSGDAEEVAGTPPYMSPEQCGAQAHVDVRSDVYSLGVLLYELLTGALPHDVAALPLTAAMRAVREDPPVAIGARDRRWRGEIESIVHKATAREPAARYASAAMLAADLRRHLRHEPVAAHAHSTPYLLKKFVQRNPVLTGAVVVVLGISVAAAVVNRRHAVRAEEARARAVYQGYLANIAAADAALRVNDIGEAHEHLRRADPSHRGWEWSYLAARADGSIRTGRGPESGGVLVAFQAGVARRLIGVSNRPFRALGSVCVWDATDGALTGRTPRAPGFVGDVAARADGGRLAWSQGGDLVVANPALEVLARASLDVYGRVRFAPRGDVVVAASAEELLAVATAPRIEVRARRALGSIVRALAFAPGGGRIAAGAEDGTVHILGFPGLEPLRTLSGHRGEVRDVCFSPEGATLASASADGSVRVWDPATGGLVRRMRRHRGAFSAVCFGEGDVLFTGHTDGTIVSWNLRTGNQVRVYVGHEAGVESLDVSADGVLLVSGSLDGTWKSWDARARGRFLGKHGGVIRDLCYAPDGRRIACGSFDGRVKVYDRASGELVRAMAADDGVRFISVRFADDGTLWASSTDTEVRQWDREGRLVRTLRGHAAPVCAVWPQGTRVFTGSEDRTLRVWDARTGEERMRFEHGAWVWDVAAEPRRGVFVAPDWRGDDGVLRVRSIDDGAERAALPIDAEVVCLAFSPDGNWLFAGDRAGSVQRWRTDGWRAAEPIAVGRGSVERIAFTPDGARAAFACGRFIRLWDLRTGEPLLTLRRHVRLVYGLAFSPDGAQLVSGGGQGVEDCEIRVWDAPAR